MKCTEKNVATLKDKVTGDYAKALPTMVQLLIAQEGIKNAKKHDIVLDLLRHNRNEAISFLNVSDPDFKKIYCEVNGIDDIPSHSVPPLFDLPNVAPTPTPGVINLRGGAGLETIDPVSQDGVAALAAAQQAPPGNAGSRFTQPIQFDYGLTQDQD